MLPGLLFWVVHGAEKNGRITATNGNNHWVVAAIHSFSGFTINFSGAAAGAWGKLEEQAHLVSVICHHAWPESAMG